jgi:hypothetical protein
MILTIFSAIYKQTIIKRELLFDNNTIINIKQLIITELSLFNEWLILEGYRCRTCMTAR